MKNSLFIIVLEYIAPIEEIDKYRSEHLEYPDVHYDNGVFVVSGPQIPRSGGIIIAKSTSKEILSKILARDPFVINKLVEHKIYEFSPTKFNTNFSIS